MRPRWEYCKIDDNIIKNLQQSLNIGKLLAIAIANRGLVKEDLQIYLNPTRHDFHNPFEMPDMDKAIKRIIKAIENREKIIIYGDYDVDGITSITVIKSYFRDMGIEVGQYIPNRLYEGYGLNKKAIQQIANQGYNLMITVDCGITSIEEIEYAKELGLETIVTDHHEPLAKIPDAIAVVDCKREDNKYPFRELAGVGVAFKLCQALSYRLNLDEKSYLKYLDIVALGTIADIVPLKDENRVITKLGMMLIKQTKNHGLRALLNLTGYSKIDSNTISFGVAPRINACGRMGAAYEGLELLLSTNQHEAIEKSKNIFQYNTKRQELEKKIYLEAIKQIEDNHLEQKNSIVLGGKDWHHGVVGIVASKITDLYYKPTLLVCYENGENIGKGSGRSIQGFDLHKALIECSNLLEGFGGHTMAVGLSIKEENLPLLQERFENIAKKSNINKLTPILKIDSELDLEEISKQDIDSLSILEPVGEQNPMPIFALKNLKIDSIKTLTEGKHLKLSLKNEKNTYINAIGFNLGNLNNEFATGDKVDVAGYLEINSFNGVDSIQINLIDIKKSAKRDSPLLQI